MKLKASIDQRNDSHVEVKVKTTVSKIGENYWAGTVETPNGTQEVIVHNLESLLKSY